MQVAFLDDSEQTNPPRAGLGHLLALSTVVFPENGLAGFADDLASIRTDLGIPASEEIKWKPPKGSFLSTAGGQVVTTLRRRMLEAALARDVRTVTAIIDHRAAYTSYSKTEVGGELLKWLYERACS